MLLAELLRLEHDDRACRLALTCGDQSWTYQALDDASTRMARGCLEDGLEVNDRVALLLPNRGETVLTYLACFKAGLTAVPLDYRYQPPQINYALRHCGARVLVAHAERQAEVAECEAARGIDLVVVDGVGAR